MSICYIMSGDVKTVKFDPETFEYEIINEQLAPLYITYRGNVRQWIEDRAVDETRPSSRRIKSLFGLSRRADAFTTAMAVNAAAITDNFWVAEEGEKRTYEEIKFHANEFFGISLYNEFSEKDLNNHRNPELTNIGSQNKGWWLEDEWWLYKNEALPEAISEYITFKMGMLLGFNMAEYDLTEEGWIRSKDFTKGRYNLQHIDWLVKDHTTASGKEISEEDLLYNYESLKSIDGELADEFINICLLDAICENSDRHVKNYGVLTDSQTGQIVSMAPNYDNNQTLYFYSSGKLPPAERRGGVLRMVTEFLDENNIPFQMPKLQREDIKNMTEEIEEEVKSFFIINADELTQFLYNGYDALKCIEKKRTRPLKAKNRL